MTEMQPSLEDAIAGLRALALAAAPATHARPDLARTVLDRSRREVRRRRIVTVSASLGGGLAVLATVAAATLLGRGEYFTVIEPSTAMRPTVQVGEQVVFDRTLRPARGDVVLVHLAVDGRQYDSVARVVALPGDSVGCPADRNGRCDAIVVNGTPMPEPYLAGTTTDPFPTRSLPAGMVFLLGDNRTVANDSRRIGPVSLSEVGGVAVRIKSADGRVRAIPGAPPHRGPGDHDDPDPAGPVPSANVSVPR